MLDLQLLQGESFAHLDPEGEAQSHCLLLSSSSVMGSPPFLPNPLCSPQGSLGLLFASPGTEARGAPGSQLPEGGRVSQTGIQTQPSGGTWGHLRWTGRQGPRGRGSACCVTSLWSAFLLGGLSFGNSSARSLLRSHFWSRTRARDIRYTALSGVEGKGSPGFEPELTPKLCSQPFGEDAGMA